jgi:hypothetical protein
MLFVLAGVGELIFPGEDSRGSRVLFLSVLALLAVLVVAGIRLLPVHPWTGLAIASIGAVLGGFALFWTGIAILLAVAVVVLGVVCAVRVGRTDMRTA